MNKSLDTLDARMYIHLMSNALNRKATDTELMYFSFYAVRSTYKIEGNDEVWTRETPWMDLSDARDTAREFSRDGGYLSVDVVAYDTSKRGRKVSATGV